MDLDEILNIEIDTLCQLIIEYSTDIYVVSYEKQLLNTDYANNKTKFILIVNRLNDWYKEEIKVILDSKYTLSVEAHQKSFEIIKSLKKHLNE